VREGTDGTPSFAIRMHNDSIVGTKVLTIGSDGAVTLKPNGITTGLRLQGRSNDNNFYVQFKSNDGNTTYSQIGTSSADTALLYQSNVHKFQNTASNNTYMTINASGMLGVGGDTPRGSYTDLLLQDTTDNAQMEFKGANTSFAISHFDNGRLGIYSNVSGTWNEARGISINAATGNVGVGTTDGDEKLHVNGSILVDAFNAGHEEGIFFRDGFSNSNKYNISILAYDHGSADAGQSTTSPDGLSINGYDGISFNVGSNNRNEVMRIKGGTSNVGNVGINEQNPQARLAVQGDNTTMGTARFQPDSNKGAEVSHIHYGTTGDWYIRSANPAGSVILQDATSATGFVRIGTATVNYPGNGNSTTGVSLTNTGRISASYNGDHVFNRNSDGILMSWRRSGAEYGSVSISNSSGTTYNTTSDRRLKTDIQPIEGATDTLMAMAPVTHKWKAHPSAPAVYGFIAQDMQALVPEAVSGDPDSDGMMSMDYGRITPVLVAALQDAVKEITALKERVAELEAK